MTCPAEPLVVSVLVTATSATGVAAVVRLAADTVRLAVAAPRNVRLAAVSVPAAPFPLATMPPVPFPTVTAPTVPVPASVPRVRATGAVPAVVANCRNLAPAPLMLTELVALTDPVPVSASVLPADTLVNPA